MKKIFIYGLMSIFCLAPFLVSAEKTTVTEDGNTRIEVVHDDNNTLITKTESIYTDKANDVFIPIKTTLYQPDGETIKSTATAIYDANKKNTQKIIDTYDETGTIVLRRVTENYSTDTGFITDKTVIVRDTNGNIVSQEKYLGESGKDKLYGENVFLTEDCNMFDSDAGCYEPLAPIQGPDGKGIDGKDFPTYLQAIYRLGIGACFVLGVIMFTRAGIEYIVSESIFGKSDARKRIEAALTGLAIALVSYILLNTINPDLLKLQDLNVSTATSTK